MFKEKIFINFMLRIISRFYSKKFCSVTLSFVVAWHKKFHLNWIVQGYDKKTKDSCLADTSDCDSKTDNNIPQLNVDK